MIDIRSLFNQLLPQTCLLCGDRAGAVALCAPCRHDLPWQTGPSCPVCALPTPGGEVCGACLKHPPAFDRTLAALQYHFPLDALLRRYKYAGLLAAADLLGSLLAAQVATDQRPDLLIPMPLHPQRMQERGFNQALEIARSVSRHLGIPLATQACARTRHTPPQAGLTLLARRKNLRGAFECVEDLSGKHIALLDDVMTTGASLDALAQCVKQAGADQVQCWVVARTLRAST